MALAASYQVFLGGRTILFEKHCSMAINSNVSANTVCMQGRSDGGSGRVRSPNAFKFLKSLSIVSHAARELATVFSGTFLYLFLTSIVGQLVKTPSSTLPNRRCLGTSLCVCTFKNNKVYKVIKAHNC